MPQHPSTRAIAVALTIDIALVVVFAVIGRASHDQDLGLAGIWQTAWPFLVGLAVGWVVNRVWRAPDAALRSGLGIWASTLIGGMLLRTVSDQGTAVAFIIVAAIVLLVFLVGWRALRSVIARRRRRTEVAR